MGDFKGEPLPEELIPAEKPAELAAIPLTEAHMAYAQRRWPEVSERMQQFRVRQSIMAKFLHAEPHPEDPNRRRFGGPQPAGESAITTRHLGKAMVEEAVRRQKELKDAMFAAASDKNPNLWERHKAAMNIVGLEIKMAEMDIVEDEYARKTKDEVDSELADLLLAMVKSGELDISLIAGQQVVEGQVIEQQRPELNQ